MNYWKVLFSPFIPFKLKWYIGKTAVGVPYFLPRKWVKATHEMAHKAALEEIQRFEDWNKRNPNYVRNIRPYEDYYNEKLRYRFPVPLKVGFSYCGLGWKTKWDDYRFEYSPTLSFVFFGYQIAITVFVPNPDAYWEAWLYYERDTDKSASNLSRILECMEKYPMNWIRYEGDKEIKINYYTKVLKKKYLKFIK